MTDLTPLAPFSNATPAAKTERLLAWREESAERDRVSALTDMRRSAEHIIKTIDDGRDPEGDVRWLNNFAEKHAKAAAELKAVSDFRELLAVANKEA